ncbi:MAG: MFS transporter [Cellvibrionales bacterium]|nr:MFS transporter [Cellvibrionales bacterium]
MPLYVAVALALFIAVMVARYLVEPTRHASAVRPRNLARLGYFDSRYRHLLLVGVVIYLGMAVSTQMMGFYLPYVLGLDVSKSATFLGLAQALMAGATVFGQLVLVQRLSWPPLKLLQVGMPLMAAGFVLLASSIGLVQLCIGVMLLGLGLGICGPGFSAAVSLSVNPDEQGAVAGFLAACPALGYVLGPFGAGMLCGMASKSAICSCGVVIAGNLADFVSQAHLRVHPMFRRLGCQLLRFPSTLRPVKMILHLDIRRKAGFWDA